MGLLASIAAKFTFDWLFDTSLSFVTNRIDETLAAKLPEFANNLSGQLSDTEKQINYDLQKAILSSHWLATKVFCEELKKQNKPADILNVVLSKASEQIKQINKKDYSPIEVSPDAYKAEILLLKSKDISLAQQVINFHIDEIKLLLNDRQLDSIGFETLIDAIQNGIEKLNWFELVGAFLNELLKGDNNKAKDAYQNQELATIRQAIVGLSAVYVNGIGEQRFEEFKAFLKEDLEEIKGKIDDILNPQPTLIYNYSHQIQSENKAIFRRRYVPFVGREEEIKQLHTFFESKNLLEWQLVTSAGGSGKSRLAMEFCYALAERNKDYQLGFYKVNDKDKIDWYKWQPLNKTLIVIDYITADYKAILEILAALYLRVNNLKYPVRFLLLEREKDGEWWKAFDTCIAGGEIPKPFADTIDLPPLFNNLLQIIAFCLQKANKPLLTTEKEWYEVFENLLKIDPLGRPLFAFYVGLALANGETIRNWKVEDLLENHLKREEAHFWNKDKISSDLLEKHKNLVALTTMMGGMNYYVLGNLLDKKYPHLPSIDEYEPVIYENLSDIREEILRPLEPDILGEYFVHKQLQKGPNPLKSRNKTKELINEAWTYAPLNMTFFVLRFYQDFYDSNIRDTFLKLPVNINENIAYLYSSMFLSLSGIMIKNGSLNETEELWQQIKTICDKQSSDRILIKKVMNIYNLSFHFSQIPSFEKAEKYYEQIENMTLMAYSVDVLKEVLLNKTLALYNLIHCFAENGLFEKAEGYYDQIVLMDSYNSENQEVLKEILIWKAKATYHLSLAFGRVNIVEKSERYYGKIVEMTLENHPLELLHEILKIRALSIYGLVYNSINHGFLEKAENYYFELKEMSHGLYPFEVLKEVLRNRVESALYYYKFKYFTSWQLALNWLVEELLKSYEKNQIAEIAIKVEVAFLIFYRHHRQEIPIQTNEQIKALLVELVRLYHKDISWQPYVERIKKDFKEFGLLPDAPQE